MIASRLALAIAAARARVAKCAAAPRSFFSGVSVSSSGAAAAPRARRGPVRDGPSEDAYFVLGGGAERLWLGLADGVGAWAARGVDPRLYPERLMREGAAASAAASASASASAAAFAAAAAGRL